MEHPHAAALLDAPGAGHGCFQLARIERLLRRQALPLAGETVLAQLTEMPLQQVAVDQRIAVVEGQRQPAVASGELAQHRQDRLGFGQPFQHCMAEHQVVRLVELAEQFLPRRLDESGVAPGLSEALAGAFEHRFGGLGEGHLMAAPGQPEGHVAKAGADIQHPQRPLRQRFGEVGLEHGEADRPLGAAVDLLGEARRQFVEMPVAHVRNRRSLSASLARTTCSMSMPSSEQSSNR
ncbi:hypothetical protein D3C76_1025630 [compost metagenome]